MLTVVLPNYNHAKFLPRSLAALFAQTRPADEIIVIDDASTDDSAAVIAAQIAGRSDTRLIRNPRNHGVVANLNRGLEMARGTKIYFAAADDLAYATLFETCVALLDQYPQAGLCSARCDLIDTETFTRRPLAAPIPRLSPGYIAPSEVAARLMEDDGWFMGPTTLWWRDKLAAIGGFPEDLGAFTDGYVSRLLALKHGACFSPEILAAWQRMPGGMAWSLARQDPAEFTRLVERKMAAAGAVFPPGYAKRWKARYVFGVRRVTLAEARRAAAGEGLPGRLSARAIELASTVWLFLRLRPFDLIAVMRRYLRHIGGRWHTR